MDVVTFLSTYRIPIAAAILVGWLLYALYHTGKLKFKMARPQKPVISGMIPPEQQLAVTKAEAERLKKENERLTQTLAKTKMAKVQQQIKKMAEEKIKALLPEKVFLLDPENQLVGRPLYFLGGVPAINKHEMLDRLAEKHFLNKISPALTRKLIDWLFFKGDTLFFYTAQMLPNGKWVLTATSKPARKTGKHVKLPRLALSYVLLPNQHQKIDDLIINKWEVTHAGAAIHLAATFLGPLPIEQYSKLHRNVGWEIGGKEKA